MYPAGELKRLALRKTLLEARIAARRWQCIEHGDVLVEPVVAIDSLVERWRRIAPLTKAVGLPVGLWIFRRLIRRFRRMSQYAHLVPVVFQTARAVAGWRRQGVH